MLQRDAVPGVHRIEDAHTNWYLVEGDGGLTVVDTGLPASWRSLREALAAIGRRQDDLRAIVLTHPHFDHVGFAERAREDLGLPVWVPAGDEEIARHPFRYPHERSPLPYLRYPGFLQTGVGFARAEVHRVRGVREFRTFRDGEQLDVPGSPRVVGTPGHTPGHVSLHLPDREALLAGDAIVTRDPYTGRRGPRCVSRAATADMAENERSLQRIAATGARTVLAGHGEVWRQGAEAMVDQARRAGAS